MARKELQKPKNFKKTMAEMISYLKPYLLLIIISLTASIIATFLQIIGPDKLKLITNEISKGLPQIIKGMPVASTIDMTVVRNLSIMLLIFYLASLILKIGRAHV